MPEDVCVLIPTLDEAATIGDVIDGFRANGYETILVIDGGSTDGTQAIARERGADVLEQSGRGKGQAVMEALDRIETEYVLMLDGDGTYQPEEAAAMLEPLRDGRAEHVIGNRFADMEPGAMTRLNRFGNRLINRTFAVVHHRNLTDVLSGYRAFTADSVRQLDLSANGFGIETELAVECVRQGIDIEVVPIGYEPRPDGSETNLHPLRDGGVILLTLYRLAKLNNPMLYYGSIGLASGMVGVALAGYVGYRWFFEGVSHEVLALLSAFTILLGVQIVMFGVLSDMILTLHREQRRRIERIAEDD
ncbi:S-layer glycoprotein N-glycosyltransferase AglJ [Natranaeroarchaeum aerophilus]|uniref:S-layer glycoprotein N-glycosyltransferase AglJ n=1 Tax=Natranaeroarchaeum aerophilus TaxID=2917711 RepID=A0AAE3K533_9EURY|nr:S-layer glycoprotein N-glycosyltransferase AglJ [Natranaeroarchaeum aerophilus]MCL9813130.1 S-layer glycoprotein N-glycosyltransferase AglJ [Natranaeroarchaeum aerophilus]